MNEIVLYVISALILVGGVWLTFRDFKESHENFYYSVSHRVKSMILEVKANVYTKDTQNLIEIMFRSLEEHILYMIQHHKFLRKKHLDELDVSRYNNLFYVYISGIMMEWMINGIDPRLYNLFMNRNRNSILIHMREMDMVMLDKTVGPKYRRRKIVALYLKMLEDIKNDYISAYDDYMRVINGEVEFDDLVDRSIFTVDEMILLYNGVQDEAKKQLLEKEIKSSTEKHVVEMREKKESR